jgi:Zn-dependent protease with chaperone function
VDWLSPSFARLLAAALLALVPAAHTWWRGRRLSRLLGDPALPERLIAGNHQRGVITGASFALGCFISGRHALWLVPVMIVAQMAAAYPLRKAIYGETWSLAGYLSFFARLYVAVFGFWLLVASGPAMVRAAGSGAWIAALLLAVSLFAWSTYYVEAAGWIVGVTPITDSDLVARFERMVARSTADRPRLAQVRVPGGMMANAAAMPSLRGSSVVFTDTLLRHLSGDEFEAIAAHEVAHLEHFCPTRLRRLRWVTWAVIVGCAGVGTLVQLGLGILPVVWAVAVVIGLALRGRMRQAHETESDLRAVSLTGNPEALVNALTKLHVLALMPRRWDPEFERRATHPSLSRRIQAIRAAAGGVPPEIAIEATFGVATSGTSVAFDAARVTWLERDGSTHSASYETLVELRVAAAGTSAPALAIADRNGRRWTIPLVPGDVLRAQAVLDAVDTRLATPPAAAHAVHSSIARLSAALFAVVALAAAQWGALVVALVTMVTPAPPLLAAGAGAAALSGFLAWRDPRVTGDGVNQTFALIMAILAVLVAALTWRSRSGARDTADVRPLAVLGLATAIAGAILAVHAGALDALAVNNSARLLPGVWVLSCALGTALAWQSPTRIRLAAAMLLVVGISGTLIGSQLFLDRMTGDPLLVNAPAVSMVSIDDDPVGVFEVPAESHAVLLSPDARYLASMSTIGRDVTRIHIGPFGGELIPFDAADVRFLNGERAVLLAERRDGVVVSELSLEGTPVIAAQHDFSDLETPTLTVDAATGGWQLFGWTSGGIALIEGDGAGGAWREQRWPIDVDDEYLMPVAVGGAGPILLETRYGQRTPAWRLKLMPLLPESFDVESRFWVFGQRGRQEIVSSRLDTHCATITADRRPLCTVFDGTRTRLVALDDRPPVRALVELPGEFFEFGTAPAGWVTGWWRRESIAVRLATREVFRINAQGHARPTLLAPADNVVGALSNEAGRQIVRLYPLE